MHPTKNLTRLAVALAGSVISAVACTDATPPADQPVLLTVSPEGGTTGVSVDARIVVEFSHHMQMDIERYAVLHEGTGIEGPTVDGMWHWSGDRTGMTFTPSQPLEHGTSYTLHLGGGMMDSSGHHVDLQGHGHDLGGMTVTQDMMDDRMMHGGMMGGDTMMGPGWRHPSDDTYGMIFTFTTG